VIDVISPLKKSVVLDPPMLFFPTVIELGSAGWDIILVDKTTRPLTEITTFSRTVPKSPLLK
jgi:hypothetical protein